MASSQSGNSTELKVPLTGEDGSCYLCDNEATHVGFVASGPFGAETGLCEGCYLREVTETPTTINPTGTRNHKKITYSDGSIGYTYETDDGYYSVTKCPFFGTWQEDGPFDLPNTHTLGDTAVEEVEPAAIPGVEGNSVPIPSVAVLKAENGDSKEFLARCPACGTEVEKPTENETWAVAKQHNEKRHDGNAVAGIPKTQLDS